MAKKRVDLLLVERGLADTRQKAQAVIMAGQVYTGERRCDKPGLTLEEDAPLEKAMQVFPIALTDKTAADIGASTGGFTDCMLQNGAKRVYAVDVGYGQLAWSIRNDPRVVCLERTNARYLTREQIPEPLDFASIDVSFISLGLILPALGPLMAPDGQIAALVKPQFEAGRDKVGKKGVVRDPGVHLEVLERFLDHAAQGGFAVKGLDFSPIRGPEGNIEYLGFLQAGAGEDLAFDLKELVERSHQALKG